MRRVPSLPTIWMAVLCAIAVAGNAAASVHASVDHAHVAVGETVLLSVISDGDTAPDFSPLAADFDVQGRSTSSQTSIVNGHGTSQQVWTIALSPRRSGALRIPALTVGREHTDPIALTVTEQPVPTKTDGAAAFIESTLDAEHPYVQQSVIYTVRLYYAMTLLDGSLDVSPSDGIELRKIGDDIQGSAMVGGRRYNIIDRRYLLTPQRSGTLQLPVPSFHGRVVGDGFDGMFDGNAIGARGQPKTLEVRPRPDQSSGPWLPAQSVTLTVDPPTGPLRAGEPFTLGVKLTGEGVTAAQLPDPQLAQIPGAQVYPEAPSFTDSMRDGHLQAERTRRFAIVPNAAGPLRIPPVVQAWWDVRNDRAAQASATVPGLQVLPGTALTNPVDASSTGVDAGSASTSNGWSSLRIWQLGALLLATGWVATGLWAWRRMRHSKIARSDPGIEAGVRDDASKLPRRGPTLTRALALGELDAIAFALLDAAPGPRAHNLGEVAQRLEDAAQNAAVRVLDAARWGSADAASALAALRKAFARPPRWRDHRVADHDDDVLPPLYPR